MNPFVPRRGMGRGMGRGRGFGRGARGFYDAAPPLPPTLLPEQEQDLLERQIKFHEEAIRALKQQLGETQKTDREV